MRVQSFVFAALLVGITVSFVACKPKAKSHQLKKNESIDNFVAVTTIGDLNLRIGPHQETARVLSLSDGMVLEVLERSEEKVHIGNNHDFWYHVRTPNGITGWVYGSFLILVEKGDKKKAAEIAIEKIREEKIKLMKSLAGFWSINTKDGNEGHHKVVIYEDGSYLAYSTEIKRAYQGDIEIFLKEKKLTFKNGATFGRELFYGFSEQVGYRMYSSSGGEHKPFERSSDKPWPMSKLKSDGYKIFK